MKRVEKWIEVRFHFCGLLLLLLYLISCPETDQHTENDLENENANQSNLISSKSHWICGFETNCILKTVSASNFTKLVVSALDQTHLISWNNSMLHLDVSNSHNISGFAALVHYNLCENIFWFHVVGARSVPSCVQAILVASQVVRKIDVGNFFLKIFFQFVEVSLDCG